MFLCRHDRSFINWLHRRGFAKAVSPNCAVVSVVMKDFHGRYEHIGTGVVIRPGGLVVTNRHVADRSSSLFVQLNNGNCFRARTAVRDPVLDLTLLQITNEHGDTNANLFEYLRIKSVGDREIGSEVVSICDSHGIAGSLSRGSLTSIVFPPKLMSPVLRTNTVAAPGGSGGALVNKFGELIGIISGGRPTIGKNVGFTEAIPSNYILSLLETLEGLPNCSNSTSEGPHSTVQVKRPYDGILVHIDDFCPQPLEVAGLVRRDKIESRRDNPQKDGVVVKWVDPAGPSHGSLQPGDRITSINNSEITSPASYRLKLSTLSMKTPVMYSILRRGKRQMFHLKLSSNSGHNVLGACWQVPPEHPPFCGLTVREENLMYIKVTEDCSKFQSSLWFGATLCSDCACDVSEIRRDDEIFAIDEFEIRTIQDFQKAVGDIRGRKYVTILLFRSSVAQMILKELRVS